LRSSYRFALRFAVGLTEARTYGDLRQAPGDNYRDVGAARAKQVKTPYGE